MRENHRRGHTIPIHMKPGALFDERMACKLHAAGVILRGRKSICDLSAVPLPEAAARTVEIQVFRQIGLSPSARKVRRLRGILTLVISSFCVGRQQDTPCRRKTFPGKKTFGQEAVFLANGAAASITRMPQHFLVDIPFYLTINNK